jgi:hypothetical protein
VYLWSRCVSRASAFDIGCTSPATDPEIRHLHLPLPSGQFDTACRKLAAPSIKDENCPSVVPTILA